MSSEKDNCFELVRFVLALHLDVLPEAINETDRLADDLGLDPLDLVLVVLRLEEIACAEFPVADLEQASTVADLIAIAHGWWDDELSTRDTLPPPSPSTPPANNNRYDSGVRIAAHTIPPPLRRASGR